MTGLYLDQSRERLPWSAAAGDGDPRPVQVLIVDESPDSAFLTAQALRRSLLPSAPLMAGDGAACLAAVRQQPPDAIVMDYHLPDIDGLALLSRIHDIVPSVPVIFATSEGNEDIAVAAMKLGAVDYVVKDGDYLRHLPEMVSLSIERLRQDRENEREHAEKSDVAPLLDEVTGVFSEEAFTAFATILVEETGRRKASFGIILVQVDEPARNPSDELTGALLRVVAGALKRTVRRSDLIGRMGARGFVVVAQSTDIKGTLLLAERLRAEIPERLTVNDREMTPSISQGLASMPADGRSLRQVLEAASQSRDEARSKGGHAIISSQSQTGTIGATPIFGLALQRRATEAAEQHRETLAALTESFRAGEIDGIAIQTEPGTCAVCADASRDLYKPGMMLPLPVIGCSSPGGCRCTYSAPKLTARHGPPPIPALHDAQLQIPRRFNDAAFFGSEPKRGCKPETLAEYLDSYPLQPFSTDVLLREGEVAYLARPARRSWEHVSPSSATVHGPQIPLAAPLRPWLKTAQKLPFLPSEALPFREEGALYLTNNRLIFRQRQTVDSLLLVDVSALEALREGIACAINGRSNRLVFLLNDPLQVGMYIARAIRDLAEHRGSSRSVENTA
jgi:diguanylate cyclase (GGDEF)-like protein